MHLKDLVMYFQKMVLLTMLRFTVSEILKFKVEEFCYISAESASFRESRHPEGTKNPYYVFSPKWSQKKLLAHGLLPFISALYLLKILAYPRFEKCSFIDVYFSDSIFL